MLRDGRLLALGPPGNMLTSDRLFACLEIRLHVARKDDGQTVLVL